MTRPHTAAALLAITSLLLATPSWARAPSKKDVDQTLLGLPQDKLGPVQFAQDSLQGGEQEMGLAEHELEVAKLDQLADKAWSDAADAVSKALEAASKAANLGNRSQEIGDLASRRARAEKTSEWRAARENAAKASVAHQQARVTWAKAEVLRLQLALELARLQTYATAVGSPPDVEIAIGKAQTKLGKQATQVGRERRKVEDTAREASDAALRASALNPSGASGD